MDPNQATELLDLTTDLYNATIFNQWLLYTSCIAVCLIWGTSLLYVLILGKNQRDFW